MSIKYIVTGGAGFIGSNVVSALNRRGEGDILIVDELGTSEKWKNLRKLRYEDLLHKDAFRAAFHDGAFTDIEAVFHLGACSSTTERDADFLADNNYQYTRELCEWCRDGSPSSAGVNRRSPVMPPPHTGAGKVHRPITGPFEQHWRRRQLAGVVDPVVVAVDRILRADRQRGSETEESDQRQ